MKEKKNKIQDLIDLKMLEERKIFLWGMVDDKSAKHVVERLMYLDSISNEEIKLYINSPGGYVTSGFTMYDTVKLVKSPVSTICTGLAASMGSIMLSVGDKGRRFIQPHAKVRILAENCGQSFEKVMKDFNRDYWMDAQESIDYGIVDGILE